MEVSKIAQEKLFDALTGFAKENNVSVDDLFFYIKAKAEECNGIRLSFHLFKTEDGKSLLIKTMKATQMLNVGKMEQLFLSEEKINSFIASSLKKFSVGAVCEVGELSVIISMKENELFYRLNKNNKYLNKILISDLI